LHPYQTMGKIRVLCTIIFMLLGSRWEDKRSQTEL
jgi:hypothetical protein